MTPAAKTDAFLIVHLMHNWLNQDTCEVDGSTCVKGGSFPQRRQEEKISLWKPEKCNSLAASTQIHFSAL